PRGAPRLMPSGTPRTWPAYASAMWKTVTPIKPSAMAGVRRDIGASLRVGHSCHGLGPRESRRQVCDSPRNMGIANQPPVGQDQTVRFFDTTLAPRATLELSATSVRYPQTARGVVQLAMYSKKASAE